MIVRFDLEGGNEAVADVHDACVFSRALHDKLAARGQPLQVDLARFVGAVLAPHHAEDAQFGDVWVAAKDFFHAGVFFGGEAVLGGDLRSDSNLSASGGHISIQREKSETVGARYIAPLQYRKTP